jgi:hypothetical protein
VLMPAQWTASIRKRTHNTKTAARRSNRLTSSSLTQSSASTPAPAYRSAQYRRSSLWMIFPRSGTPILRRTPATSKDASSSRTNTAQRNPQAPGYAKSPVSMSLHFLSPTAANLRNIIPALQTRSWQIAGTRNSVIIHSVPAAAAGRCATSPLTTRTVLASKRAHAEAEKRFSGMIPNDFKRI